MSETENTMTVADQMATVSEFLDSKIQSIAQVLRSEVEPEHFIQVAKMAVTRNPKLLTCVPMTLYGCLHDAAKLGLDIHPITGEFWLIPRKNKYLSRGGPDVYECTGMIGYKGFITLGLRSRVVEHAEARVVYQDEWEQGLFHLEQATGELKHTWNPVGVERGDDKVIAAYGAAWLPGVQRPVLEPMTREMLDKRRRNAQTDDIWRAWYVEMCRKTAIRYLFGRGHFPLTVTCAEPPKVTIETPKISLAEALSIDDNYAAARQDADEPIKVEQIEAPADQGPVPEGLVVEEKGEPKEETK